MKAATAKRLQALRITMLAGVFACLALLFLAAGGPGLPPLFSKGILFAFDPLLLLVQFAAAKRTLVFSLLGLPPLLLTLLLGRFFCGWICPLGAAQEFAGGALRGGRDVPGVTDSRVLRIKYLVLVALTASAALGVSIAGWLDPFSLLTRSAAGAVVPAFASVFPGTIGGQRVSVQPVLIGSLFLFILALSAWRRRFFCTVLCPLGALYGLAARYGLLHLEARAGCNSCRACAARCPHEGGCTRTHLDSECLLCFRCAADCPTGAVSFRFTSQKKSPRTGVDLGRRRVLGSLAAGLAAAALPMAAPESRARTSRRFLRPPGAVAEKEFLERCARCGQCAQACPTGFIQPALLEAGIEGMWTPVCSAKAGYCDFACVRCTRVCPTGALKPLELEEKRTLKVGTAVMDKNLCYTYADGFNCTACADRCPVPEKALRFREAEVTDFRGKRVHVRQVYVVPDLCTGCGICEHVCPRGGSPGVFMTAEDEAREATG